MLMTIVFILLMILLILSGGAALHLGIFKAHRPEISTVKKTLGGVVPYGISAAFWLVLYSYHYLGW
jgi:hypothetical protein